MSTNVSNRVFESARHEQALSDELKNLIIDAAIRVLDSFDFAVDQQPERL